MYIQLLVMLSIMISFCHGLEYPEMLKHDFHLSRCKRNHESSNPRILEKMRKDPLRAQKEQLKMVTNLLPNRINKVDGVIVCNPQTNPKALNLRLNPNVLKTHKTVAHNNILNNDPKTLVTIDMPSKIVELHENDNKPENSRQTTLENDDSNKIIDKKCHVPIENDSSQEMNPHNDQNSSVASDNRRTMESEPTEISNKNNFFEDSMDVKDDEFDKHKKIKKQKHKCCHHRSHKTKSTEPESDPEISNQNHSAAKIEKPTVTEPAMKMNNTDNIAHNNTINNIVLQNKQKQNLVNSTENNLITTTDKVDTSVPKTPCTNESNEINVKNETLNKQNTKDDAPGITRIEIQIKDKPADQRKNETNTTIVINNRKVEEILERSKDRSGTCDTDKNDGSYWYNEPQNWNYCTQTPYTYQNYDRQNDRDYTQPDYYSKPFDCNFQRPDDAQYELRPDDNKFSTPCPYNQNYQSPFRPNIPVGYNRVWRSWKNIEIHINKPADKQLIIELEQNGNKKELSPGTSYNRGQSVIRMNGCYNNQNNPSMPYYLYPNVRYA